MDTHTSYSRVNQYLRCSLAYRFKYVDGLEQEFLPAPLIFGVSFHRAVEIFFRAKMEGHSIPTLDELHTTFRLAWEEQAKDSAEIRYKEGEDAEILSELARKMLEAFLDYMADKEMDILAVEQRFSVELTPGMPPLLGYIDLVERLQNGEIRIVDFKTSAKRYSESSAFDSLQLAAYAAIAKALGHRGEGVQVAYIVLTKAKVPAVQRLAAVLDDSDINRFTKIAQAVHHAVGKEAFVPNPGWQCSGCMYRRACAEEMSRAA